MKIVNPRLYTFGPLKQNKNLDGQSMATDIVNILVNRGAVKVSGLGIFKIVKCKPRGNRTLNGRTFYIKGYNKIKSTPTEALRDNIQKYGN